MILNLSRSFHFDRDLKKFHVDYLFSKEAIINEEPNGIFLVLNVSVNNEKKKKYRISKSTSTLYLSNEDIEKMIEEDTLSVCK